MTNDASAPPPGGEAGDPPVLDRAAAARLQRIGGGRLLREMIELFLQHAPARVDAAEQAFQADELAGVERAAHSLKSTAGNLGGAALQQLAQSLEDAAEEGERERVAALMPRLRHEYERLRDALLRIRDAEGGAE